MGPAEIVASLKELCAEKGPRLGTEEIVAWIETDRRLRDQRRAGRLCQEDESRQYARMLEYEDEDSGMRIKRLWSFHDQAQGRRFYADILELPADERKRLIRQYARFLKQIRAVRKAMADYFAGQRFFDFYSEPAGRGRGRVRVQALPRGRISKQDERRDRWLANGPPFA